MLDIHLDLETGGLSANAALYSIGAVAVQDGEIIDQFHMRISPQTGCNRWLRHENRMWWLANNPKEWEKIQKSLVHPTAALTRFQEWITKHNPDRVWVKRFMDPVWLESAYSVSNLKNPIGYQKFRELVTYLECKGVEVTAPQTGAHNALNDATHQAKLFIIGESK